MGALHPHYHEYLKLTRKRWMFSDLLMMNKEQTILTNNQHKMKVLNLLYHCYKSTAEALKTFYIDRKPELFDAHVGESACQIRAVKLAVMLKEINIKTSTEALVKLQTYEQEADRIYDLLQQYKIPHNQIEGPIFLLDFLSKYRLDACVKSNYLFLLISYVLCIFRNGMLLDKHLFSLNKFKANWQLSRRQAEKLLSCMQTLCSFFSVDFALENLNGFFRDRLLICYQIKRDVIGRWLLPCLFSMNWLIQMIKHHQIHLFFKVHVESDNNYTHDLNCMYSNGHFHFIDRTINSLNEYKHEPQGQLLGQCCCRKFFSHAEN